MVLWGPFAAVIWVILYGVPVGLAWLYEKYLVQRGGFWITIGIPFLLLMGAVSGFIGYLVRNEFLVAPFIGYAIAGGMVIRAIILGFNRRSISSWSEKIEPDKPHKSQRYEPKERLRDDANSIVITCGACFKQYKVRKGQGIIVTKCPNCGRESRIVT